MEKKIFIDCGAHKGQSIIKARKKYGDDIIIYAFEAVPYLAYSLQEYYKYDANINVFWNIVGDKEENVDFHIPLNGVSNGNSIYPRWHSDNTYIQKIPSIDLSNWIRKNFNKDDYLILKLDIEGAEYSTLSKMIDDGTVDYINEFHGEWHEKKISNIDVDHKNKVNSFFKNRRFHIWEAEWLDESNPGMISFPEYLNNKKSKISNEWALVNPFQKITFIIPTRNNLEFLKLAYDSIRRLDTNHEILILNDYSIDGTKEWIDSKDDKNLIAYHNEGPERIGIVGMFDKGISMANTDVILAFHSDMVASPNLDKNILKYLKRGSVVSATRVEPPLHPDGPEKIIKNFGIEVDEFSYDDFCKWIRTDYIPKHDLKITEGIFAPWCMYKEDFLSIGGHDNLFSPQSKEDSDLFNRFLLNGYEVIQSWDALVYHFTSRGSRFNKYVGGDAGKNSNEWLTQNQRSTRNFIRKWGHFVKHTPLMKPIVPPKYNIGIVLENSNYQLLSILEPWCDRIYVDSDFESYIQREQKATSYDLTKRITSIQTPTEEIVIHINGNSFNNNDYNVIQNISDIINDSGAIGQFELGNLKLDIREMNEYQNTLIYV